MVDSLPFLTFALEDTEQYAGKLRSVLWLDISMWKASFMEDMSIELSPMQNTHKKLMRRPEIHTTLIINFEKQEEYQACK